MRDAFTVFAFFLICLFSFSIGGMVGAMTTDDYEKGFCAARGGVWISGDYCDVEGKVVRIER